jgi:hypothetical protein
MLQSDIQPRIEACLDVLVSHIPAKPETPFDDRILMSAGGGFLG